MIASNFSPLGVIAQTFAPTRSLDKVSSQSIVTPLLWVI